MQLLAGWPCMHMVINEQLMIVRFCYLELIMKNLWQNLRILVSNQNSRVQEKKFIFTSTEISVDVSIEGEYPADGSIGPISFPNPKVCQENIDDMQAISLPKLIDLKLTLHKRLPTARIKD
ncbi:unnamed protein product [Rotaria sp. Silwood1]|nr:unnamed protein product [Rotaria sp. Silwood1]CAF1657449.1 unnamed protein product [Rotaria sp. Silwood1]CAF4006238.1 unnamed protein product [Rotaria sp. Silwood1]